MEIKTFGTVDQRSLEQLKRCMSAGDADYGVLCADHHPGYSQPIGGAIAYEGYVSPSGVGYDIGCIAAGEPVLCGDGCARPIEAAREPLCVDAGGILRRVDPFLGVVARGRRDVLRLTLSNGRGVTLTEDHEVRTDRGWVRADALTAGDAVLCPAFAGWPCGGEVFEPALTRIAGYVNGSAWGLCASSPRDAAGLASDLAALELMSSVDRRVWTSGSIDVAGYLNDHQVRERLDSLGCDAGDWSRTSEAVLALPDAARASYLSAFASAAMSHPPRMSIEQRGIAAIEHVVAVVESLGFDVGVSRSDGGIWSAQVVGGPDACASFIETVGFNHAAAKRALFAGVVASAWERSQPLSTRTRTQSILHERLVRRERVRGSALHVGREPGLSAPRLNDGSRRGSRGWCPSASALGESAYARVVGVEPAGERDTFDVVTADSAEAFVAGGIAVHNCGNKAVCTDLTRKDLDDLGGVERIMREITRRVSFGVGVPAREKVDHPVLDKIRRAEFAPQRKLAGLAASQLGTVGSGNHYVNVMEDEQGRVWVGVHFGSRGFGHKTASGFLAMAQGLAFDSHAPEGEMDSPPVLLETGTELGDAYISAMELAGEYAYAGRDVVVSKVLEILSAEPVHEVHNHHNFAWREEHGGGTYWVVRKGCTPAQPGQEGFVGGSMGDESVILEGVESDDAQQSLFSTVHGAGRIMSRSQAAGRVRRRRRWACNNRDCDRVLDAAPGGARPRCPEHPDAGVRKVWLEEQVRPGKVDWPAVQERLRSQGIVLVGGGADEAPEVYKRLPEVLGAHAGTIRVKHTLRPLGVAMAGRDVYDPYKD